MVILGYLLSGLLPSMNTQFEASKINETKAQLEETKNAIIGFTLANRRLPCPDTDGDGQENTSGGNCSSAFGEPPWADLALQQFDSWNQTLIYRVTTNLADTTDGSGSGGCAGAPVGVSIQLCSIGDITVTSTNFNPPPATLSITSIPAILVSTGKPRGSTSATEAENTDNDSTFRSEVYNTIAGNEFNDIVVWIPIQVLVKNMVDAGIF